MSRLFMPSLLVLAAVLAAPTQSLAQEVPPPSPSADRPILHCMYGTKMRVVLPTDRVACDIDSNNKLVRFTMSQLYAAGWRVAHYDIVLFHDEFQHHYILESK